MVYSHFRTVVRSGLSRLTKGPAKGRYRGRFVAVAAPWAPRATHRRDVVLWRRRKQHQRCAAQDGERKSDPPADLDKLRHRSANWISFQSEDVPKEPSACRSVRPFCPFNPNSHSDEGAPRAARLSAPAADRAPQTSLRAQPPTISLKIERIIRFQAFELAFGVANDRRHHCGVGAPVTTPLRTGRHARSRRRCIYSFPAGRFAGYRGFPDEPDNFLLHLFSTSRSGSCEIV
ncbi:hypothetical protein EVAR_47761_1 [Eumeta japonica]|uniref:Uncharacterized protein n=1 Tax=Eumeta variegata TaxID=151549 RepID=A0A4C1XVY2_EUMVA|nr:hypothetical protein EVAR_47761_1 [Eumeta japonica]